MKRLREYHFDFGDTNAGAVGACAVVRAYTKKEAVEALRSSLPDEYETGIDENDQRVVYFTFYLNSEKVTVKDIDESSFVQRCEECKAYADEIVGCPDGAEICRECFENGAH